MEFPFTWSVNRQIVLFVCYPSNACNFKVEFLGSLLDISYLLITLGLKFEALCSWDTVFLVINMHILTEVLPLYEVSFISYFPSLV